MKRRDLILKIKIFIYMFIFILIKVTSAQEISEPKIVIGILGGETREELNMNAFPIDSSEHIFFEFLKNSDLNYEVKSYNWFRARRDLKSINNLFIYAMSRTPARESKYTWVLPLYDFTFNLYGNSKKELKDLTKKDLISGKYRFACTKFSNECEALASFGIAKENLLEFLPTRIDHHLVLLTTGRVDFIYRTDAVMKNDIIQNGLNASDFYKNNSFEYKVTEYLTASKHVNKHLLEKIVSEAKRQNWDLIR